MLFSDLGWTGTSMRDVASKAGVSVETLYALFGSKPALFQAALTAAVRGDRRPVPLAERPEFQAQGEGNTQDRIRAGVHLLGRTHDDAAGLHRALREASASDPNLGKLLAKNEANRKADTVRGFELATGRRPTPTERDGVWALQSFEVYDLLVERSGWSLRRYEDWLASLLLGPLSGAKSTEKD